MRYRELTKRLRKMGCRQLRAAKGSHRIWYNPATDQETVIPDWGAKDLSPGTYSPGHYSPVRNQS